MKTLEAAEKYLSHDPEVKSTLGAVDEAKTTSNQDRLHELSNNP